MNNFIRYLNVTNVRQDSVTAKLHITATDIPGAGGDNHSYHIAGFRQKKNPSYICSTSHEGMTVYFQNGEPETVGINGITIEALLAICIDRLDGCQRGPFACGENDNAILALHDAMKALNKRATPTAEEVK